MDAWERAGIVFQLLLVAAQVVAQVALLIYLARYLFQQWPDADVLGAAVNWF